MDTRTQYTLGSLIRVDTLIDEHASDLPGVATSVARQDLRGLVGRMREHGVVQRDRTIQARGQTQSQRVTKRQLRRRYMAPIASIASLRLHDVPDFADLKLPDSRVDGQALLDAALGMLAVASKHSDVFIADGLRPTFVEEMTALVSSMQQNRIERDSHQLTVRSRTVAAESDQRQARKTLGALDSLVRAETDDIALLAKWDGARRVGRKPGVARGSVSTSRAAEAEQVITPAPTVVPEPETPEPVVPAAA